MSDQPPGTPPGPPPSSPGSPPPGGGYGGPPPPASTALLPWTERSRLGWGSAFVDTVKMVITEPGAAFARVRRDGDFVGPIIFALILGFAGVVLYLAWNFLFKGAMMGMLGSLEGMEGMEGMGAMMGMGVVTTIVYLIFAPIFIVIGLFIAAGIYHLALMLLGATDGSPTGFEGTFKIVAYAQVAQLAGIVPLVGGLIAFLWQLYLFTVGFAAVHRTDQTKSLIAALTPLILCCVCLILVLVLGVGGSILGGLAGSR